VFGLRGLVAEVAHARVCATAVRAFGPWNEDLYMHGQPEKSERVWSLERRSADARSWKLVQSVWLR